MFLAPSQYVILLHVCFGLKTPYLVHPADALMPKSQPTALQLMPEQSLPPTRHPTAFLGFRALGSTWALRLGAILKSEITKTTKMWKDMALHRARTGYVFTV